MIDARIERLISLTDAAEMFPGLRKGTRMNPESLSRLARKGFRGIQLETVMAGGRRCTTAEAVQRFISQTSQPQNEPPQTPRLRQTGDTRGGLKANHKINY
jgi:hypothetical protein